MTPFSREVWCVPEGRLQSSHMSIFGDGPERMAQSQGRVLVLYINNRSINPQMLKVYILRKIWLRGLEKSVNNNMFHHCFQWGIETESCSVLMNYRSVAGRCPIT